jgi:ABC-type multidrug transport system ATPase subunit
VRAEPGAGAGPDGPTDDELPDAPLVARGLEVRYQGGPEPAVTGIDLTVPAGTGLVVGGDVGSGKTSVLRALAGLVAPAAGRVRVLGGSPLDPAVRRRIGWGPEKYPFPRGLRMAEAIRLTAASRGLPPGGHEAVLDRVGLRTGDDRPAERLEVEEVRRLSLACAVLGDPEVLILDDPWEFPETVELLRAAMGRGAAVVVASPDPGGFPALLGAELHLEGRREPE